MLDPKVIKMIKHHEGVRLRPYLCPAHIWSIGIGRVLYQEQIKLPVVRKDGYTGLIRKEYPLKAEDNRVWTQEEVDALLAADLQHFTRGVIRLCGPGLTPGQLGALTSFAFNAGLGRLQSSSIRQRHLRKDFNGAAEAFMLYNKGGGQVLPGLVKRRKDEAALYLS